MTMSFVSRTPTTTSQLYTAAMSPRPTTKDDVHIEWFLDEATTDNASSFIDYLVAPGLRLWMLLALVFGIFLMMTIIICCFMKLRIPRTKREIELHAAKRKNQKRQRNNKKNEIENVRSQLIVMKTHGAINAKLPLQMSGTEMTNSRNEDAEDSKKPSLTINSADHPTSSTNVKEAEEEAPQRKDTKESLIY